jgi:RNA polymerase sigma-70 factor (ECF subfamily)
VHGPLAALAEVARLDREPMLADYYLLPSVKAGLFSALGDHVGAARRYREALSRPCNEPERRFLTRRLSDAARLRAARTRGSPFPAIIPT